MTLTFRALCWLHAFEHRLPVQDGLAFESLLRTTRLDYSVQSLERIDVFLDALRTTGKITQPADLDDQAVQNLLSLLAFYTGEVIGRAVGARPHWATYEEVARQERQPGPPVFGNSATLSFPGHAALAAASFLPLVAISARLLADPPDQSVLASAGQLLPPEALHKPMFTQPLPSVPPPAWPVERAPERVRLQAPAGDEGERLRYLFDTVAGLLQYGRVVWGAVVLADKALFKPGPLEGARGEILYDPQGRVPDADLHAIARTVLALKGRNFDLPDLASIAQYLNDDAIRVFGLDLPARLAAYPLKVSSTWFDRAQLPGGVLAQPLIPVLVSDAHPGAVLPLPAAFWPAVLSEAWSPAGLQPMVEEELVVVASAPAAGGYVADPELAHLAPASLADEGLLWFRGEQVAQDYGKARMAWSQSAAIGNADGLHGLGQLYEQGLGVDVDLQRALAYYEQAGARDHAAAREAAVRIRKLPAVRGSFLGRLLKR